jgi:heme exporter protein CcmD
MSHGFYVWLAYGVMLLVMSGEVLVLALRRRALRQRKSSERAGRS